MRKNILIALAALILSACASHEHMTPSQAQRDQQKQDHYSFIEGPASRIR